MNIYKSSEDYLERILLLQKEIGNVRSIDIATSMSFSKASVSVAMKKLRELGYIEVDSKGYISFTEKGLKIAENIYERHTIIYNSLLHIGVSKDTAYEDACKLEHELSEETFNALKNYINKNEK